MARTHYDVLGIPRDASAGDVRAAYRARARTAHPDAGGDPDRMRQLNAAWHVLGDPQRRAAYDRLLARGVQDGPGQGFGATHAPHRSGGPAGPEWAPDLGDLDLTADEILDLLDDRPMRQTMALAGWWAILPPGTLVAAAATMFLGVWFMSPPVVALAVGLLVLALGLFVLAPLRAMARRQD